MRLRERLRTRLRGEGGSPIPYIDSRILAPGTAFGQGASTAVSVPYYFPSSNQNRPLNTPFAPTIGLPLTNRDGQLNDVGIIKAQYTKNIGSNAYARLFGYTFYSDWMLNGPDCAATGYFDGYLMGGLCGNTADYTLNTHTRGAEFQFADQINAEKLAAVHGELHDSERGTFQQQLVLRRLSPEAVPA